MKASDHPNFSADKFATVIRAGFYESLKDPGMAKFWVPGRSPREEKILEAIVTLVNNVEALVNAEVAENTKAEG